MLGVSHMEITWAHIFYMSYGTIILHMMPNKMTQAFTL